MNDIEVDLAEPVFVFQLPEYYNAVIGKYPTFDDEFTTPAPVTLAGPRTSKISNEEILLLRAARKAATNDSR